MIVRYDTSRDFDRIARRTWGPVWSPSAPSAMPMDVHKFADRVEVEIDLPGADPSSIDVTVEKGTLTVSAQRQRAGTDDGETVVSERQFGTFSRRLTLGRSLDGAAVEAHFDNGVLRLTVPVSEQAKARKVDVIVRDAITDAGAVTNSDADQERATVTAGPA